MAVTQKYELLQGENNLPLLSDIHQLVPSNDYTIPEDIHNLKAFIGAFSIIWDILVGVDHPLAISLRNHYRFWDDQTFEVINSLPDDYTCNLVIVGTLRSIQLAVHRYVNDMMYSERDHIPTPTFQTIVDAVDHRAYRTLPSLPAAYLQSMKRPAPSLPLPPVGPQHPRPPNQPSGTTGNQLNAAPHEKVKAFLDAFLASPKKITSLRYLADQPKATGTGLLCLSWHLKGQCCDNCLKIATHRKLDKAETDNMNAFIKANL